MTAATVWTVMVVAPALAFLLGAIWLPIEADQERRPVRMPARPYRRPAPLRWMGTPS